MNTIITSCLMGFDTFHYSTIDTDSIVVKHHDSAYLVGNQALKESLTNVRAYGNEFNTDEHIIFVKALFAKMLGEGEHRHKLGYATPYHLWDTMRESRDNSFLKPEWEKLLKAELANIEYLDTNSDDTFKTCRVDIDGRTLTTFETYCVAESLPHYDNRNFIIWQIGHGDWQQLAFSDNSPIKDSVVRTEGMAAPFQTFKNTLDLIQADAHKSWRTLRHHNTVDVIRTEYVSCRALKQDICRHYINGKVGELLNQYKRSFAGIIISGGACHDDVFMTMLIDALSKKGIKAITIEDIKDDMVTKDPLFTAAAGAAKYAQATIGIDIGNSSLKGVLL